MAVSDLPGNLGTFKYKKIGGSRFKTSVRVRVYIPDMMHPMGIYKPVAIVQVGSVELNFKLGLLTISKGFEWDGASGPTWDTESIRRSALVHDALYFLIRHEGLELKKHRKTADRVFYNLLKIGGVNGVRRWYYYLAVRSWFGKRAAKAKRNNVL